MAYDEDLADRVRALMAEGAPPVEKKMFGGISFMLQGNMCCGVVKDDLVVRVGPEQHDEALAKPHARVMDFTGRPMEGWIYVGPQGLASDEDLKEWVQRGTHFALSLPAK